MTAQDCIDAIARVVERWPVTDGELCDVTDFLSTLPAPQAAPATVTIVQPGAQT